MGTSFHSPSSYYHILGLALKPPYDSIKKLSVLKRMSEDLLRLDIGIREASAFEQPGDQYTRGRGQHECENSANGKTNQ